MMTVMSAQVE